jgi:hypothetical protein
VNAPEEQGAWLETNGKRHILHGTCSVGRAAANTLVLDLPKPRVKARDKVGAALMVH